MDYTKEKWIKKGNKIIAFGKGTIAICPSPTDSEGVLEFIANANLIALAPDMYEALKLTRDNLQTLSDAAIHYKKTFSANLEILNQALAKVDNPTAL